MILLNENFYETIKDLFFMEDRFIKTNKSHNDWIEEKTTITSDHLNHHFNGYYYIGSIQRNTPASYICLDLDCHNGQTERNLKERYDQITDVFKPCHLICRTPLSGLHLYYFLNNPKPHQEIKEIVGSRIQLKKGEIELFPSNNGLRLFGGKKCPILDRNLNIIADKPQSIAGYFSDLITYCEYVNLDDFQDFQKSTVTNAFINEVEELIEFGLKERSTRNDALLKINRYLQGLKGCSQNETIDFMIKWITDKNNGKSKDWIRNKATVINQIRYIAKGFDPSKFNVYSRSLTNNLSKENINSVEQLISRINKHTNIDVVKFKAFAIDLYEYCKKKNINGKIEIPKVVFQKFRFGSGNRYLEFKDILIKLNVLKVDSNYSTLYHKSIRYQIDEIFIS
ncbi:MAG: hypothetical protein ACFFFT_04960 [Candidatus Thorarchaeota archaeon]